MTYITHGGQTVVRATSMQIACGTTRHATITGLHIYAERNASIYIHAVGSLSLFLLPISGDTCGLQYILPTAVCTVFTCQPIVMSLHSRKAKMAHPKRRVSTSHQNYTGCPGRYARRFRDLAQISCRDDAVGHGRRTVFTDPSLSA